MNEQADFINDVAQGKGYAIQDVLTSAWNGEHSETIKIAVKIDLERTARQFGWDGEELQIQTRDYLLYDPEDIEAPIPLTQVYAIFKIGSSK